MSSVPFMQLYVSDYLSDTLELTTEQHGAYLLLLMTMWRSGASLKNDEKKLCRIARVSPSRWRLVWPHIQHFFYVDGSEIRNSRLDKEYEKAASISIKRIEAGRAGGVAKSLKEKETAIANGMAEPKHSHNTEPEKNTPTAPKGAKAVKDKSEDEGWFDEAIRYDYPKKSARLPALRAWMRLSKADKMACAHGVVDFSMRFDEKMKTAKRPREEELRFVPDLSTFINQRRWELEKEISNETANR